MRYNIPYDLLRENMLTKLQYRYGGLPDLRRAQAEYYAALAPAESAFRLSQARYYKEIAPPEAKLRTALARLREFELESQQIDPTLFADFMDVIKPLLGSMGLYVEQPTQMNQALPTMPEYNFSFPRFGTRDWFSWLSK